jgi:hypothetical protein
MNNHETPHWSDEISVPETHQQGLVSLPDQQAIIVVNDSTDKLISTQAITKTRVTIYYKEGAWENEACAIAYSPKHGEAYDLMARNHATLEDLKFAVKRGDPTIAIDLEQVEKELDKPESTRIIPIGPKIKSKIIAASEEEIPWDDAA